LTLASFLPGPRCAIRRIKHQRKVCTFVHRQHHRVAGCMVCAGFYAAKKALKDVFDINVDSLQKQ
jgi:hydrogenase maturation factor HypE